MNVYAIKVDDMSKDISLLWGILSKERIMKCINFKRYRDQYISILSEVLVKYMLYVEYHLSPCQTVFKYNEFGKPYIKDYDDIFFNISHSDKWIVCVSSNSSVGIDVESEIIDCIPIAKRFFSPYEIEYILKVKQSNQKKRFNKIWTLKESYIKCVGKGLVIPLNSFCFEFHKNRIFLYIDNVKNNNFFFLNQKIDKDYYLSVCVNSNKINNEKINIKRISIESLMLWKESLFF